MARDDLGDATRRAVLRGAAGALGVTAMGGASAHEWGSGEESGPAGTNAWTSQKEDNRGETTGARVVGYHSLGSIGSANPNRQAEAQNPHYGGLTEIRTHGDYAYVGVFSSGDPTPGRGMAILDISDYTRIPADATKKEQEAMLENAELSVVSFLRNNNPGAAVMDVKVSDDGDYVFLSTQPYQALFGTATGNTEDPTVIEGLDPTPNLQDDGATLQASGIVAVDVSDKANPQTLGNFAVEGSGSHNAFHHRIGGDDYIFAINDSGNLAGVGEGMFVLRFDRTTGSLELVNQWEYENNFRQGEAGPENVSGGAYIHDMEVQDDPRTGTPIVYLAYWDQGMYALDASDPENLVTLGRFDMGASHFVTPAPTLVKGKRVVVTSQEISENDHHTGRVYLVDADGLFEGETGYDADGATQLGELDVWEWQNEHVSDSNPQTGDVEFGPYDFSLSPHNSDFVRHVDPNSQRESFWIHQAHYGGGVRFLEVVPGSPNERGLVGDKRFAEPEEDKDGNGFSGVDDRHNGTSWKIHERGFSRPTYGTPKDSRLEGLNYITPFVWGASQENGVTFASDINQGVHAIKADRIPIGGAQDEPFATVERSDDGSLFTAGQTNKVDLALTFASDSLLVRDRLPDGWGIYDESKLDDPDADGRHVVFDLGTEGTGTYFAEAPSTHDESGSYTFGPVEISADGGETWYTLPGTTKSVFVLGQSTAIGSAALAVGALGSQRDRLTDRLGALLDSGE